MWLPHWINRQIKEKSYDIRTRNYYNFEIYIVSSLWESSLSVNLNSEFLHSHNFFAIHFVLLYIFIFLSNMIFYCISRRFKQIIIKMNFYVSRKRNHGIQFLYSVSWFLQLLGLVLLYLHCEIHFWEKNKQQNKYLWDKILRQSNKIARDPNRFLAEKFRFYTIFVKRTLSGLWNSTFELTSYCYIRYIVL